MKHLSLWLTVILLGAMPLAAAAFDYGPNQPLLAANGSVPQLPGTQMHATADSESPHGDVLASNGDDAGAAAQDTSSRTTVVMPHGQAAPARRNAGASNKRPPPPSSAKPLPVVPQATWQSLLPGSIQ